MLAAITAITAITVALAGCAPAAAGGGTAAAPARPAEQQRPRPETRPAPSAPTAAGPVAFAYAATSYRYVVSTEARIEVSTDSGERRSDSRAATAYVSYRVAPGQPVSARTLTGAIDSLTVA